MRNVCHGQQLAGLYISIKIGDQILFTNMNRRRLALRFNVSIHEQ